jgi:hypothetical protein
LSHVPGFRRASSNATIFKPDAARNSSEKDQLPVGRWLKLALAPAGPHLAAGVTVNAR